jgi:hypothetical protein
MKNQNKQTQSEKLEKTHNEIIITVCFLSLVSVILAFIGATTP